MADDSNSNTESLLKTLGTDGLTYTKVLKNAAHGAVATSVTDIYGVGDLPVFGTRSYVGDACQIWTYDTKSGHIKVSKTSLYAYPEDSELGDGTRVLVGSRPYKWNIEPSVDKFIIGRKNANVYWTLENADRNLNWSPIVLKSLDAINPDKASLWSLSSV